MKKKNKKKEELTRYEKQTLLIQKLNLIAYIIISIIMILLAITRG